MFLAISTSNHVEGYQDHYEFPFGSDYITPFILDDIKKHIVDIYDIVPLEWMMTSLIV
jgi:hypothetical protein